MNPNCPAQMVNRISAVQVCDATGDDKNCLSWLHNYFFSSVEVHIELFISPKYFYIL